MKAENDSVVASNSLAKLKRAKDLCRVKLQSIRAAVQVFHESAMANSFPVQKGEFVQEMYSVLDEADAVWRHPDVAPPEQEAPPRHPNVAPPEQEAPRGAPTKKAALRFRFLGLLPKPPSPDSNV